MGSVTVLGKLIFFPQTSSPDFPKFTFPTTIPLREWQFVQSYAMTLHQETAPAFVTSVDAQTLSGRHYQYLHNEIPLAVEMRYFVDTYLHVPAILEDSTLASRKPDYTVVEVPTGEYAVVKEFGKVHRSACITQYGGTSVSDRMLRQRQNTLPVLSRRFFPWFLGQAPLRDLRCLWVKMAIDARVAIDQPRLMDHAWLDWVQWWQKHYPD
nr:cyanoexosortase A system-associated protein [Myxacorys almedinensis]